MAVCVRGVVLPFGVALLHFFLRLLFVAEDFYDLLTVYHLFDISVKVCKRSLLGYEIRAALADNSLDYLHNEEQRYAHNERQTDADIEHAAEYRHDGERRRNQLTHRLREHLAQGICIVGIEAHRVAVGVRIEISYRQALHLLEHLIAYGLERSLRYSDHAAIVDKRRERADEIDDRHGYQRANEAGEVG